MFRVGEVAHDIAALVDGHNLGCDRHWALGRHVEVIGFACLNDAALSLRRRLGRHAERPGTRSSLAPLSVFTLADYSSTRHLKPVFRSFDFFSAEEGKLTRGPEVLTCQHTDRSVLCSFQLLLDRTKLLFRRCCKALSFSFMRVLGALRGAIFLAFSALSDSIVVEIKGVVSRRALAPERPLLPPT